MQKTNKNRSGIQGILSRAKKYNSGIGTYKEHFFNDRFNYTIRLSNGRIEISMNVAQDQERMPASISEETVQDIANSFKEV
ncbi:hypothetical protein [Flavobacterium hercynium]|uniref:Uncharacterized protein n=1 Tax=Flavobacterium hercynium TaxID=387094 RepID=A0A226GXA4_9FLAO|nr:hypothetical protein [Flavobacterium hercynium]OXA85920.1 hypothetical protein B0A66_18890 [Flavobacterium hercynium]SMP33964.1 hypothetical protein SAMN06265346_11763 [Flavobacterium hercynium]